jgi:hypothetical protein
MKTAFLVSLALVLSTAAAPAMTQQSNRTVLRAGNWYVVRSTQPVTGTVACTGFYMGQSGVELSKDSLIVRVPGDINSVGLRFGEEPARSLRPAEKTERQIGGVMLAGADFKQLRRSKTLSLDVTTAQGRTSHTLQVEGLDAALKNIEDGCPLTPASLRAERAVRQARAKAEAAKCTPAGIARMREKGYPEVRIVATCPKAAPPPAR